MSKKKDIFKLIKEVRGSWTINPKTRVKGNDLKNEKKRRQEEKKIEKE